VLVLCFLCVLFCACFVHILCSFCALFVQFLCSFVNLAQNFCPFSPEKRLCLFCACFVPVLCRLCAFTFLTTFQRILLNLYMFFVPLFCAYFCAYFVPILCLFCAISVLFWLENYDIFGNFYIFGNCVPTLCLLRASLCSCLCQVCAYSVLFFTSVVPCWLAADGDFLSHTGDDQAGVATS
jgi:hypothetical protein